MVEIYNKNETKIRLSYLFSEEKTVSCVDDHKNHIEELLYKNLNKPLLSDNILDKYKILGLGIYGKTMLSNLINLRELGIDQDIYSVVVKENKNYIEDINEIFINQVRINTEVICKNNPNFPIMFSYILCHPSPKEEKLCQSDIVDLTNFDIEDINTMLKKNILKMYGLYSFINGITLAKYITTLKFIRLTSEDKWEILKHFLIQVFSSLDNLTQSGQYTHYDLHPGNIMITEENFNHTYTLTDKTIVEISESKHRCFIIDQGLSNAYYDNKYFIYESNPIKPFLHSFDIYKILVSLYLSIAIDKYSINELYSKKLRALLKSIFNNSIIKYITTKPNGDVITYLTYLNSENIQEFTQKNNYIVDITYNNFVNLLIKDVDISSEEDIEIQKPPQQPQQPISVNRPKIPIIIKGRK